MHPSLGVEIEARGSRRKSMGNPDTVFLVSILGSYVAFVLLMSVLDERRLERRR